MWDFFDRYFSLSELPKLKRWALRLALVLLFGPFILVWLIGFFGDEQAVMSLPEPLTIWLVAALVVCANISTIDSLVGFYGRAKHWDWSERIMEAVVGLVWIGGIIWLDCFLISSAADKLS